MLDYNSTRPLDSWLHQLCPRLVNERAKNLLWPIKEALSVLL